MTKKAMKKAPKAAAKKPAPISYEEPILEPKASPPPYVPVSPASVIADCPGPGASGKVGLALAGQILIALQQHGYTIEDEKIPF